ncbi:MAG: PqqD family protein [Lachnospiraceae bacterium]|nr:PqqD family protein [Lachnospiraceae bacterium]
MKVLMREVFGTHYLIPLCGEGAMQPPVELNETAYEIYQLLSEGKTIEEVTTCLSQQYQIAAEELQSDVESCYQSFYSKGII